MSKKAIWQIILDKIIAIIFCNFHCCVLHKFVSRKLLQYFHILPKKFAKSFSHSLSYFFVWADSLMICYHGVGIYGKQFTVSFFVKMTACFEIFFNSLYLYDLYQRMSDLIFFSFCSVYKNRNFSFDWILTTFLLDKRSLVTPSDAQHHLK